MWTGGRGVEIFHVAPVAPVDEFLSAEGAWLVERRGPVRAFDNAPGSLAWRTAGDDRGRRSR